MSNRPVSVRRRLRLILANTSAIVVAVVLFFPIYWMIATAFKSGTDILSVDPQWIPQRPTLANFTSAIHRPHFIDAVVNSAIIVTATVAISLAVAFFAAIAVARFSFFGRKAFLLMLLIVQMIPMTAMIIPIYLLLNDAGQTNKLPGVVITYLTFVLPFAIWTLRGFIVNIPAELEEAAMMDGCTRFGALRRIIFPLVAPGLVATSIFAFIQAWNEYLLAYVLLSSPENRTLTVWLAAFTTRNGTAWGPLMAASTLTALPVVVFFVAIQRKIAAGLTAGAVKG
ncbi:carbohydrate ABC transporter permease [Streptomyces sp. H51]|uniref:carbohydrate ABC transporter permease n=1 Tax=Streptomyces sp. H51 TaxID=3111770 RepID=UPI002D7658BA|nr:carbohydrate ABC transporter permease [Streptomyces sp. H51]